MEHANTSGFGKARLAGVQRELKEYRERTNRLETVVAELIDRVTVLERTLASKVEQPD